MALKFLARRSRIRAVSSETERARRSGWRLKVSWLMGVEEAMKLGSNDVKKDWVCHSPGFLYEYQKREVAGEGVCKSMKTKGRAIPGDLALSGTLGAFCARMRKWLRKKERSLALWQKSETRVRKRVKIKERLSRQKPCRVRAARTCAGPLSKCLAKHFGFANPENTILPLCANRSFRIAPEQ